MDNPPGALAPGSCTPEKRPTCTVASVPLGNGSALANLGAEGTATPLVAPLACLSPVRSFETQRQVSESGRRCEKRDAISRPLLPVMLHRGIPLRLGCS